MARPETQSGDDGYGEGQPAAGGGGDPAPELIRPGTGVVRPGTGVRRPGAATSPEVAVPTVTARASVPEAPPEPIGPIQVVLPVIEVMPAKQTFLDRLIAPKKPVDDPDAQPKLTRAEKRAVKAAEKAEKRHEYEQARADEQAQRESIRAEKARLEQARFEQARFEQAQAEQARLEAEQAAPPVAPAPSPTTYPPTPPGRASVPTAPGGPGGPSRPGSRDGQRGPGHAGRGPGTFPNGQSGQYQGSQSQGSQNQGSQNQAGQHQSLPYVRGFADPDARPVPRRKRRWLIAAGTATVLAIAGGIGIAVLNKPVAPRWQGSASGPLKPVLAALDGKAHSPAAAAMADRLASALADSRLGGRVSVSVVDALTGESLMRSGPSLSIPASTEKVLTAAAVLSAVGPEIRLKTRVVTGAEPGELVLVGGGDATLAINGVGCYQGAARLDDLASQVSKSLNGSAVTKITVDSSLFEGNLIAQGWDELDVQQGYIGHITALMTDGARRDPRKCDGQTSRYPRPDLGAGQAFANALGFKGPVTLDQAPIGATEIASVSSPPVSQLVEIMLAKSDNMIAETLARQVAIARGVPASFAGAAQATKDELIKLGFATGELSLVDGSGLSYDNQVSAALLTAVLAKAAGKDAPQLSAILSGLPVAGYSGTLANRFRVTAVSGAVGVVRAKTGTLGGVNSLAGLVVDADGRLLAFSAIADQVARTLYASDSAEAALDMLAASLASCGCG